MEPRGAPRDAARSSAHPPPDAARFGAHLAADAGWAATSRLDGDTVTLELWERDGGGTLAPRRTRLVVEPVDQLLPVSGRQLLICRGGGSRHTVWAVDRDTLARARLGSWTGRSVRLLRAAPGDPDERPWILAYDGERSTLTRLAAPEGTSAAPAPSGAPIELPGAYTGGVWIDRAGRAVVLGRSVSGEPRTAVEVDLEFGTSRTFFEVTAHSNDNLQAWHPGTGLGVVHTDVGGVERLGYAHPARGERWVFPDGLAAPDGLIEALTVDPAGHRIVAHEQRGVYSLLHRYDIRDHRRDTLPLPPGTLVGQPVWNGERLVVPWSTPEVPLTFVTVEPAGARTGATRTGGGAGARPARAARAVTVPGATRPIEAVAYGGADWWRRPRLAVALHGGPASAWRFTYHPFFTRLAHAGVAVLAVNPRGSTGYGHRFAAAIRSGWGGPDLDDVLSVGRYLHALRGPAPGLGVLGTSYGGFLALLAAAAGPELWRYCAAVAPFASASKLHQRAGPGVRRMIERSGGLTDPPDDGLGSRDAARLGHRTRAPILLVHGRHDEEIPVAHVRELAAALVEARGPAVRYVECAAGHDIDRTSTWDLIHGFIESADPSRTNPSRTNPNPTDPNHAEPSHAGPILGGPARTEPPSAPTPAPPDRPVVAAEMRPPGVSQHRASEGGDKP